LHAAAPLGIEVVALHVHHGLSPHADAWLAHCRTTCERWAKARNNPARAPLTFAAERLSSKPGKGESVEAWARAARYAALTSMARAHDIKLVLLAQHRRDQGETFLLQALRGAGVEGLAAMAAEAERSGITWARPWLKQSRELIDAYVRRHRLQCIEDDSNADTRFDHNRLRQRVWPHLLDAFPGAETALCQSATWAHEAASALKELAQLDLQAIMTDERFDVASWALLSIPRRRNALRAWLRQQCGFAPSPALTGRLGSELPLCSTGRWPLVDGELRCHRGKLTWHAAPTQPFATHPNPPETTLRVKRAGRYDLPGWGGALHVRRSREGGVALAALAELELLPRRGSEQFQAGPARPPRSLKKQFQSVAVPAWQRMVPLVYSGGKLIFVPGLGIDARCVALPGEPQMRLEWEPVRAGLNRLGRAGARR
jgi:tRNA(Ile)-lysidine synthase